MTNLKALANGKQLVDSDENILYLKGVVLGSKNSDINQSTDYDMTQLDELSIYVNPLQTEVDRLNQIIATMIEEKNKRNISTSRNKYNHLSKEEVREIEIMITENPKINRDLIISTYNSSQPVISRIANGIHVKNSETYKTYLMKKALDEKVT